ncbi:hypothetical protein [Streptomyces sp. t39]|uniref:hypothetical protein n=1 Tax=Streptomyces sp. t39 TaxID=1828156 RepID=UPI0011CECB26|nr:hypothetical protein [Streptomyces sp. t39]TXS35311.1 hypothetical protein EAO77_37105 [Streptomyces sp. t39]
MTERFRTRPFEIEAIQWTGDNIVAVLHFIDAGSSTNIVNINCPADRSKGWIDIPGESGTTRTAVGDWITRGSDGRLGSCKADLFDATFEPASP